MEKEEKYNIKLNETDYNYISEILNTLYKDLLKFPKKMRTSKFYILENLVNNAFKK